LNECGGRPQPRTQPSAFGLYTAAMMALRQATSRE
jgi:hypothetical protein